MKLSETKNILLTERKDVFVILFLIRFTGINKLGVSKIRMDVDYA